MANKLHYTRKVYLYCPWLYYTQLPVTVRRVLLIIVYNIVVFLDQYKLRWPNISSHVHSIPYELWPVCIMKSSPEQIFGYLCACLNRAQHIWVEKQLSAHINIIIIVIFAKTIYSIAKDQALFFVDGKFSFDMFVYVRWLCKGTIPVYTNEGAMDR